MSKLVYFNKPQRLTQLIGANTTIIVAGRRTGKTDSIAAPFVLRSDIADRNSDVSKAFRRGKAASKVKLHSQEMMLAQVGSPLAIENAHRNLLDMEDDE